MRKKAMVDELFYSRVLYGKKESEIMRESPQVLRYRIMSVSEVTPGQRLPAAVVSPNFYLQIARPKDLGELAFVFAYIPPRSKDQKQSGHPHPYTFDNTSLIWVGEKSYSAFGRLQRPNLVQSDPDAFISFKVDIFAEEEVFAGGQYNMRGPHDRSKRDLSWAAARGSGGHHRGDEKK